MTSKKEKDSRVLDAKLNDIIDLLTFLHKDKWSNNLKDL
jgi:hypothetical protein